MMTTEPLRLLALATSLLLLAACGGGGGGGGTPAAMSMTEPSLSVSAARTASETLAAATEAAKAPPPRFSSVTQSASTNISPARTATTQFNGRHLRTTVAREDNTTLVLDSTRHTVLDFPVGDSFFEDYRALQWGLLSVEDDSLAVAHTFVNWDNDDPTDYLAGGYWVYGTFHTHANNLAITGVEVGAFVDGPELALSNPPHMPVRGQATYAGPIQGLYMAQYGDDFVATSPGSIEAGVFASTIVLGVDFGEQVIGGCVGCGSGFTVEGIFTDAATGEVTEFTNAQLDYRIQLGVTPLGEAGTFRGRDVTIEADRVPITRSSGAWGGRFSNIADGGGRPRLVAGTVGAESSTAGGTTDLFLGAFGAAKLAE